MIKQPSILSKTNVFYTLIVGVMIALPFVMDSRTLTILLTQFCIFAILAMSYDILLGYTGIISFGHAMFLEWALIQRRLCSVIMDHLWGFLSLQWLLVWCYRS